MFRDEYEDVSSNNLLTLLESLDGEKWTLLIWNTVSNEYDERSLTKMVDTVGHFDDVPFKVSANLTMSSKNRMYIKVEEV